MRYGSDGGPEAGPDAPTEPFRRATRPLAVIPELDSLDRLLEEANGLVCARCGKATGNNAQGHYWALCRLTMTTREFHFCCPGDDPGCDLGRP